MVQPERVAHGLHLADEEVDRPEVGGLLDPRVPAADLVVEDDAPAGLGEQLERLEVVVQRARPAVQASRGSFPGSSPSPTMRYQVSPPSNGIVPSVTRGSVMRCGTPVSETEGLRDWSSPAQPRRHAADRS